MPDAASGAPTTLQVGTLSRGQLLAALEAAGVGLNASAEVLLRHEAFEHQPVETFGVVQRTVGQLGLTDGAPLSVVLATAQARGLSLCPVVTGPYLRLAMLDQESAPDSVLSNGSAPSASVTIASPPLDHDDVLPKGFYLRVVDGRPWLRDYHATDEHVWSSEDRLAFRVDEPSSGR
ncbi:MAG: hypothetical protein ACTHLJ_06835 [Angustibacter sp.]